MSQEVYLDPALQRRFYRHARGCDTCHATVKAFKDGKLTVSHGDVVSFCAAGWDLFEGLVAADARAQESRL